MNGTIQGRSDHVFKVLWQDSYKFTASLENTSVEGYTTEKLIHPMSTLSLPIYWGNPRVGNDFNTESFINVNEYNSMEEVAEHVKMIDNNNDLYLEYLSKPWFKNRQFPKNVIPSAVLNFFEKVLDKGC